MCACVHVCTHPSRDSSPSTAAPSTMHCARVVRGSFFCRDTTADTSAARQCNLLDTIYRRHTCTRTRAPPWLQPSVKNVPDFKHLVSSASCSFWSTPAFTNQTFLCCTLTFPAVTSPPGIQAALPSRLELTEGDLTDFLSTSTPCWPCRHAVNFLCVLWETCLTSSRRFSTWCQEKKKTEHTHRWADMHMCSPVSYSCLRRTLAILWSSAFCRSDEVGGVWGVWGVYARRPSQQEVLSAISL